MYVLQLHSPHLHFNCLPKESSNLAQKTIPLAARPVPELYGEQGPWGQAANLAANGDC